MRGMILAAGLGKRMGALTEHQPKPLLKVGDKYLIEYAIGSFKSAGITDIIINVFYHAQMIKTALGTGSRWGVRLTYSHELERLETGGGIVNALPFFQAAPFMVLSADVISDFDLSTLAHAPARLAHLVMVPNPEFHPTGDFGLQDGVVALDGVNKFTFGNIAVFQPELFKTINPGVFPLSRVLKLAIRQQQVTGELFTGNWFNVGTPADILAVEHSLA